MATIYCRSTDGSDSDDGSTWALAKATLQAAMTAAGAGGTVYLSHQHSELPGESVTLTSPGTVSSWCKVICVNDGAEPPTTLATSAVVGNTGSSYAYEVVGYAYFYGVQFRVGVSGSSGSQLFYTNNGDDGSLIFESCLLEIASSSSSGAIQLGGAASSIRDSEVVLINTPLKFNHTSSEVWLLSRVIWKNTASAIQGTIPTGGILTSAGYANSFTIELNGIDLSGIGTNPLFRVGNNGNGNAQLSNCRLPSSFSMINSAIETHGDLKVMVHNCYSGSTAGSDYYEHYMYQGASKHRTNCYLNATYSMQMVSTAGCSFVYPLISPPIAQWNTSIGVSLKATIEIISTATLEDDEIWLEIEYLGSSSYPISSLANDKTSTPITSLVNGTGNGTAQASSTAVWTEDLSGEVKQKLEVTFTPNMAGYVVGRVHLAKANQTVYVDPKLTIEAA